MKRYWVYIHTCPNGKKYVGITTRSEPERRWGKNGEGYYQNEHLYKAILKYGWTNFEHEAWELTSESEMYYAEKYLIAYYHTTESEFGYNHSSGGEKSALGYRHSEETRKKMSEAGKKVQKKVHSDPEYLKKISEAGKKKWADPEYKKRISEARKKRCSDPEFRKKMSEARKGTHFSEEVRKHMSEAAKKRCSDPEYRKKQSEARKGKPKPRISIKLPDGTIVEITKQHLARNYINKGKKFEYVSE